jgi:hypothetical protein
LKVNRAVWGKLGPDGETGETKAGSCAGLAGFTIIFQTASYCNKLYIKACRVLSSSGIFRFEPAVPVGGTKLCLEN